MRFYIVECPAVLCPLGSIEEKSDESDQKERDDLREEERVEEREGERLTGGTL